MDTPEAIAATYLQRHATHRYQQRDLARLGAGARSRGGARRRDDTRLAHHRRVGVLSRFIGWIVGFVLLGGLDYMFLRRIRGEEVQIGDIFAGFNLAAAQSHDGGSREVAR